MSMSNEEIEQQIKNLETEVEEVETPEEEVETPDFDLETVLESMEPIDLTGKITEEQAIEQAKKRGWNESGVDKFGHRLSAIEFLERTPFFRTIDKMKERQEKLNHDIEELKRQNQQIAAKSVADKQKLMAELKQEREKLLSKDYLDEDDIKQVKKINQQIETDTTETVPEKSNEQYQAYIDAAERFKEANKEWYESDYQLTTNFDRIGEQYARDYHRENGILPDPQVLMDYAMAEIKRRFPEKFVKKQTPTRVTTTGTRVVTQQAKQKKTLNDIPEEIRGLAQEVMEATGMSVEQYLKTYRG